MAPLFTDVESSYPSLWAGRTASARRGRKMEQNRDRRDGIRDERVGRWSRSDWASGGPRRPGGGPSPLRTLMLTARGAAAATGADVGVPATIGGADSGAGGVPGISRITRKRSTASSIRRLCDSGSSTDVGAVNCSRWYSPSCWWAISNDSGRRCQSSLRVISPPAPVICVSASVTILARRSSSASVERTRTRSYRRFSDGMVSVPSPGADAPAAGRRPTIAAVIIPR